ncbi:OsmC family protein [Streptomyces sp. R08]|uniref:OsmC family protein n=1 Tax=Streptomyces sp. R08 TaxID=3238624 RepID=A0AB39MN77_9ACTN
MRNSFNTAGFSEVVHETREDPAEAWFSYMGRASHSPRRGLSVQNGPAMIGRVKSVRNFGFAVAEQPAPDVDGPRTTPPDGPTPIDLALTGVAACSLATLIAGGSATGALFDTVEMLIQHGAVPPQRENAVDCRFEISRAEDGPLPTALLDRAVSLSPNHRTLIEHIPLTVSFTHRPGHTDHQKITETDMRVPEWPTAERRLRWVSGPQFLSVPAQTGTGPELRVDQPKQITGVDWGPNPQEYLLMALSSDIASTLARLSADQLDGRTTWNVVAQARIDIRGLLHADPSSLIQLQDVSCTVSASGADDAASGLAELVTSAVTQSRVADLICRRQAVNVWLTPSAPTLLAPLGPQTPL